MVTCNVNKKLSPPGENSSAMMASKMASPAPATASIASNPVTVVVEDLVGNREAQQRGIGEKRENKKVPYQNVTLAGTPLGLSADVSASSTSLNTVGAASANDCNISCSQQVRGSGGISQNCQNSSLFQLEDKKVESQSTNTKAKKHEEHQLQLLKKAALEKAYSTEFAGLSPEQVEFMKRKKGVASVR